MENAQKLLEKVRRLDPNNERWVAIYVNMSHLLVHNQGHQQVSAAANAFDKIARKHNSNTYRIGTGDVIFLCEDTPKELIQSAVESLKNLFHEDPFAANNDVEFCMVYSLQHQYPEFLSVVANAVSKENSERLTYTAARSTTNVNDALQEPLTLEKLQKIEDMLKSADVSNLVKHQAIFELDEKDTLVQKFQEVYLSITELRDQVAPFTDFYTNPWLFFHLTRTLDRRVLTLLRHFNSASIIKSYSVNLNISTVLSPIFQTFHESFKGQQPAEIIIEIQKMDAFADIGAFTYACDFLKERGYKVCLDGITHMMLPLLNLKNMPIQYAKLFWFQEFAGANFSGVHAQIKEMVGDEAMPQLILSRCDTGEGFETGKKSGIKYFQGYYIDKMISEKSRKRTAI